MATQPPMIAILTPAGRGAVATVRLRGDCRLLDASDRPLFRSASGKPVFAQPIGRLAFGRWGDEPSEEVVVCRHSEHVLDVHCHAGRAAIERICSGLISLGCRRVSWDELESAESGFLETECWGALTRSTTLRTADRLLEQCSGLLQSALAGLVHRGIGHAEHRQQAERGLQSLLAWARFGLHLTEPWDVVFAGRPNVGKSSLINALAGYQRSIVHEQPGTTRDVVTVETALDGWPIRLSDTAGLRDAAEEVESAGVERARSRLAECDCLVLLIDTSRPRGEDDVRLLSQWPQAIVVAHKCDLANVWGDRTPQGSVRASAKTGEGVEQLAATITGRLVPEVPPAGTPLPVTRRQVEWLGQAHRALRRGDQADYSRAITTLLHGESTRQDAPETQGSDDAESAG